MTNPEDMNAHYESQISGENSIPATDRETLNFYSLQNEAPTQEHLEQDILEKIPSEFHDLIKLSAKASLLTKENIMACMKESNPEFITHAIKTDINMIGLYFQKLSQTITDCLTNVSNRRGFTEKSIINLSEMKRRKESTLIGMIDIDNFKIINETYGHDVGDIVLKTIAQIIKSELRTEDVIGRMGGEEFAVLLSSTNNN